MILLRSAASGFIYALAPGDAIIVAEKMWGSDEGYLVVIEDNDGQEMKILTSKPHKRESAEAILNMIGLTISHSGGEDIYIDVEEIEATIERKQEQNLAKQD